MTQRPEQLTFVETAMPDAPIRLMWNAPSGAVSGYVVYSTANPFPPEMAKEIFAGRMAAFVDEQRLGADANEFSTDSAAPFYAIVGIGPDDVWFEVEGLRDAFHEEAGPAGVDPAEWTFVEAVQPVTYLRARWSPPTVPGEDTAVELYVVDQKPTSILLDQILAGQHQPTFTLSPDRDGFIDTATELEWRKHWGAVAVDRNATRRPLALELGPFVKLERPGAVEDDQTAHKKLLALMEKVVRQLDVEVRARSTTREMMEDKLARARTLYPGFRGLERIEEAMRERFGD